jgi:hypothetical protein
VRFKSLAALKRRELGEVVMADLPQDILITQRALSKAFKISELVRALHQGNFEWYGFTLAARDRLELIVDIGLPRNDENSNHYVKIGSDNIGAFQETLSPGAVINGWIHSHGDLEYREFSPIDEENHLTVLNYVSTLLRRPVAKKEVAIKDLVLLVKGQFAESDLEKGSVNLITDVPVAETQIWEAIYGSFCYAIVIGEQGWHKQEIRYQSQGILSGQTTVSKKEAELIVLDKEGSLSPEEIDTLRREVETKIQPITYKPEKIERM